MKSIATCLVMFLSQIIGAQLVTDSLLIEGNYRTFHFYKPAGETKGASLLFIMHGSGGTGFQIMKPASKLQEISAKENLLIVYPDGYKKFWNECRRSSNALANTQNINENAFFEGMINYFAKWFGIDEKKVYAAGFSGGGHMAYKFGLTMPDKFRAVAAIVANQPDSASSDCGEARRPIPVLIINGTSDETNPYNGGEMFVNNTSFGIVQSTENTFRYWAGLAGYKGDPVKKQLPDTDPLDKKIIESYTYKATNKPEVTLLKVIGGKHDYPNDVDVYLYAWDFFKRQMTNSF